MDRRYSKLTKLIFSAALLLGFFVEPDTRLTANEDELKWWVGIGFVFFLVSILASALMEAAFWRLANARRGGAEKLQMSKGLLSSNRGFLGWSLIFFFGIGLGFLISALWRGSDFFWIGLAFLSSSAGLVVGKNLARRILKVPRDIYD